MRSVRLGANSTMASLDQAACSIPTTLADALTGGGATSQSRRAASRHRLHEDFLFRPEQARTPVGDLSGGERGRLMLARALATALQPPGARRADQRPRPGHAGPAGRDARRLSRHGHARQPRSRLPRSRRDATLVGEAPAHWVEYAGGYSDMVAQRGYGLAEPARRAAQRRRTRPTKRPRAERGRCRSAIRVDESVALGCQVRSKSFTSMCWSELADADLPARSQLCSWPQRKPTGNSTAPREDEWRRRFCGRSWRHIICQSTRPGAALLVRAG